MKSIFVSVWELLSKMSYMFRAWKIVNKLFFLMILMSLLGPFSIALSSTIETSGNSVVPQKENLELRLNRSMNFITDVSIEPARRMRGKEFEWDHKIWVALPPSYHKTNKSYPVLWVTDGFYSFDRAIRLVYSEIRQYVPEMIVVGVGIPLEELEHHIPRRAYEFTLSDEKVGFGFDGPGGEIFDEVEKKLYEQLKVEGKPLPDNKLGGAPKFLDFLVDEVRPALTQDYRLGQDHTLFGHSGGGYFCTYALLARTEEFSKYICGSPNLHFGNHDLFHLEKRYAKQHDDMKAEVFFGAGEAEMVEDTDLIPAAGVVSSMARMVEILRLREYPSLNLHARIFQSEDHVSVIPMNLGWGLRTLWQTQNAARTDH